MGTGRYSKCGWLSKLKASVPQVWKDQSNIAYVGQSISPTKSLEIAFKIPNKGNKFFRDLTSRDVYEALLLNKR